MRKNDFVACKQLRGRLEHAHPHCLISTFAILLFAVFSSEALVDKPTYPMSEKNTQPPTVVYYLHCKKEDKDQESIQSSTTTDPGYQWESDNVTIRHHKREPRGQPLSQQVTIRHQQTDVHERITKQDRNNINDPQKKQAT